MKRAKMSIYYNDQLGRWDGLISWYGNSNSYVDILRINSYSKRSSVIRKLRIYANKLGLEVLEVT